jgi:hypothetical protein
MILEGEVLHQDFEEEGHFANGFGYLLMVLGTWFHLCTDGFMDICTLIEGTHLILWSWELVFSHLTTLENIPHYLKLLK